jgi:hypothetical protein
MKNKIEDLRNHLFATLEALQDKDNPMPLDRAKAISEVAQTIINTAKVEVEFLEVAGGKGSGFIPLDASGTSPPAPALPRLVK